jgi:hypothetical protein
MALRKTLILRCLAERGLEEPAPAKAGDGTTPIQTIGNFLTPRCVNSFWCRLSASQMKHCLGGCPVGLEPGT